MQEWGCAQELSAQTLHGEGVAVQGGEPGDHPGAHFWGSGRKVELGLIFSERETWIISGLSG